MRLNWDLCMCASVCYRDASNRIHNAIAKLVRYHFLFIMFLPICVMHISLCGLISSNLNYNLAISSLSWHVAQVMKGKAARHIDGRLPQHGTMLHKLQQRVLEHSSLVKKRATSTSCKICMTESKSADSKLFYAGAPFMPKCK